MLAAPGTCVRVLHGTDRLAVPKGLVTVRASHLDVPGTCQTARRRRGAHSRVSYEHLSEGALRPSEQHHVTYSGIETSSMRVASIDSAARPCGLCSALSAPTAAWDIPLAFTDNFVAVPSLGALVEGWLLLVPRAHAIAVGELSPAHLEELIGFKQVMADRLAALYGAEVWAFEHGPCGPARKAGCGVDHAHMHLVPYDGDIVEAATPYLPNACRWATATWSDCRGSLENGSDYLAVERISAGRIQIASAPELGSQVFRRAIASGLNKEAQYDWRSHPMHGNVARTIAQFSHDQVAVAV